ncbi:MAG: succinate dehydrogenase/fumarate reductase flavoprotein subunit, partial [Clostridia bacterium]|nr:succinate dehydrogenase/fumarate reductase flavoprotein subunit [Clostridia bacterium]
MYPDYLKHSLKLVEDKREYNIALQPERMSAEDKEALLAEFHPDFRADQYTELRVGANKGEKVNTELAETLMGRGRIHETNLDLDKIDYETDV